MTKHQSTILKFAVGLAGILFLILCFTAYQSVGGGGFDNVLAEPWGLVTLADVMLGGVCMGAVIFTHEQQKPVAAMWIVPIFVLGHVVSVVWLLARFLPTKGSNQ